MKARKICMIGDFAVGKTSLVARFVHRTFGSRYLTTVGVKVDTKIVRLPSGDDVKLVIWDIAGKSALAEIDMRYLRDASAYLLVIDGTRPETFESAMNLQADVERSLGPTPFSIMLNKADLVDQWCVSEAQVATMTARGWTCRATSALSGDGVEETFSTLGARLVSGP